jgi:hypothetical protein
MSKVNEIIYLSILKVFENLREFCNLYLGFIVFFVFITRYVILK